MESTCARGILRRQLSHWRAILYGMPDTESAGKTTACHFSTLPALQIHTTAEGSRGNGCSIRRGFQRPPLQPTASKRNANRDTCPMKWRNRCDMASLLPTRRALARSNEFLMLSIARFTMENCNEDAAA